VIRMNGHEIMAEVDALKRLQVETAAEVDALLPAMNRCSCENVVACAGEGVHLFKNAVFMLTFPFPFL
jgi:hypothetical protein